MKTTDMTERITFCSVQEGINPKTHRPIKNQLVSEFTCWTEVPKLSVREFTSRENDISFRRSNPTFLIAYKQKKEIQNNWIIKWRNRLYTITGMDPDFQHKDVTTIVAQEVEDYGSYGQG